MADSEKKGRGGISCQSVVSVLLVVFLIIFGSAVFSAFRRMGFFQPPLSISIIENDTHIKFPESTVLLKGEKSGLCAMAMNAVMTMDRKDVRGFIDSLPKNRTESTADMDWFKDTNYHNYNGDLSKVRKFVNIECPGGPKALKILIILDDKRTAKICMNRRGY